MSGLLRRATEAILDAIGRTPALYDTYVLKGGLALHFGYGSPRRSHDVDLNAIDAVGRRVDAAARARLSEFRLILNDALLNVKDGYEFETLEILPGRISDEMPTLLTEVRYRHAGSSQGGVKLQLTLSDVVCETARRTLRGITLHLAALEDILAEKLKALLQQADRDKVRSNDVFDLWYFLNVSPLNVDPANVSDYFLRKYEHSADAPPRKHHFHRKSIMAYSSSAYEDLDVLLPDGLQLPPFNEAYTSVLDFVGRLNLPE